MRLKSLSVKGLFGLFNHHIEFNLDGRITILFSPNGYGKTVLLNFIAEMFGGGSLAIFRKHEFAELIFAMDDGSELIIKQWLRGDADLFPGEVSSERSYQMTLHVPGEEPKSWDPTIAADPEIRRVTPVSQFERYIPFVIREGSRAWRDARNGKLLTLDDLFNEYYQYLPDRLRKSSRVPTWLDDFRGSLNCQFIQTQRLVIHRRAAEEWESDDLIPAVKNYAEGLSLLIRKALADSATLSQSLDRTFPNRLLSRMRASDAPRSASELRAALEALETRRARLISADLLDKSEESALIPQGEFSPSERQILSEYVEDAQKKLAVFEDILTRIELFTEMLTEKFRYKTVKPHREHGFVFEDIRGRRLEPEALSSGEQHQLVLAYDLIFKTKKNTLLLIDEPEISLHIAWQRKFLPDLRRILSVSPMDVVLSTHSPQLIGGDIDLAVELRGPDLRAEVARV